LEAESVRFDQDTVQAFELVLPNEIVTIVTATSNADLFFGLKVRAYICNYFLLSTDDCF
jgi:hypothetical protein